MLGVGGARANGHGKAAPLGQDRAHRADAARQVVGREAAVAQAATGRIDHQVRGHAVPLMANTSLPSSSWLARRHSLHRMQRFRSSHRSGWLASTGRWGIELVEAHVGHAQRVGGGLQQAIAAFLAAGAEVVALDKQQLREQPARASSSGVRFSTTCPARRAWCRRRPAPIDRTVHSRQAPLGPVAGASTGGHGGRRGWQRPSACRHPRKARPHRQDELLHPCRSRWAWHRCGRSRGAPGPVRRPGRTPARSVARRQLRSHRRGESAPACRAAHWWRWRPGRSGWCRASAAPAHAARLVEGGAVAQRRACPCAAHQFGAHPAGRAKAAALVGKELRKAARHLEHVARLRRTP
jgi:hypothetical protein